MLQHAHLSRIIAATSTRRRVISAAACIVIIVYINAETRVVIYNGFLVKYIKVQPASCSFM
jgi:hypothetical protein